MIIKESCRVHIAVDPYIFIDHLLNIFDMTGIDKIIKVIFGEIIRIYSTADKISYHISARDKFTIARYNY